MLIIYLILKNIKFFQEVRIAFDTDLLSSGDRLELSIVVSAGQATIDMSYEIEKISQYVDFINLAAYDVKFNLKF